MKTIIVSIALFILNFNQSKLYEISFELQDGSIFQMSSLFGKKVMVVICDSDFPDLKQLSFTDSAARLDKHLYSIIIVPATDLSKTDSSSGKMDNKFKDINNNNYIISKPMPGKKDTGGYQHPLLKWLTNVNENGHFDRDVESEGQIFLVDDKGILFGVHPGLTKVSVISVVLSQQINE